MAYGLPSEPLRIRAVFMRGGTSKGLVLHQSDLPVLDKRDALFLALMGSPDMYGRQLDGMGGGISSLSKVCIVGPPTRDDADVDYTFGQVMVNEARVVYGANCGNMSSAIGPFAVDEHLVTPADGETLVRIHNTNTSKIIHAAFEVEDGRARVHGDLEIPGVPGSGAAIRLEFLDPGGATTGALLPTGLVVQDLEVPGQGKIRTSMVDAANACVFIAPEAVGLDGCELPATLGEQTDVLEKLEAIRAHASVAMGIASDVAQAHARRDVPFIGMVAPPKGALMLSGKSIKRKDVDLTARMLSSGQPHQALPLTASLCIAVAARIRGSLVREATRGECGQILRIGMPSGILEVGADVGFEDGEWVANSGYFFRTARRLFDGYVYAS